MWVEKWGLGHYEIECFDKEVIGNIYDNPELIDKAIAKSKLRNYEILAWSVWKNDGQLCMYYEAITERKGL